MWVKIDLMASQKTIISELVLNGVNPKKVFSVMQIKMPDQEDHRIRVVNLHRGKSNKDTNKRYRFG